MHGNVSEWTGSEYDAEYDGAELLNVTNITFDNDLVMRGGAWSLEPRWLRSAARLIEPPFNKYTNVGFRLARDL